ncbi:tether containing UBX domain for GLUT4-like isoform X1 [Synchiropus splendidus]|uniref:tether containing UBX domain for GLUT4-like isoform X1 n=1 Tax=Synchiropus splendidus TaxID=270530 RepID=UPI00237D8CA0|nr:tether containing UBX domain for GLUT4-like isoform X1 [Synchiropus splendidus]
MAASGTSVTVLVPNGRRQTVKVSANTPLLQVLEDVCKKHGFNPDDHGLKFQRTVVDLSLQWRFANLPNNAKLEVVPSTRKQVTSDGQVRIALQMEDGSRLQGSFSSGQSLWELLTHFPQISLSQAGSTPVCVYMRDEVCGEEALKKATLKSLGLTGGNAIVRFIIKKEKPSGENGDGNANVAVPIQPCTNKISPLSASQPDPSPIVIETVEPVKNATPICPMETLPDPEPVADQVCVPREEVQKQEEVVRQKVSSADKEEDGEKAGPSRVTSHLTSCSVPAAAFVPFSGGGQRLGGSAAEGHVSSSISSLSSVAESPKPKKAKPNYSTETTNQATSMNSDEDMNKEDGFLEPVEREPLIYHLESVTHRSEGQTDLPDEFFEVTMDDVRKRFAQLKSERKLLEEAPLMTKSLREAQMKEKMERYPKVVLRVQFPDRHVLQGFFRPMETVGALRHFVKSHLEDPRLNFYLFITPPKTVLNESSVTLFQADLFPGALVYFGSNAKTECYLKRELLGSSVSLSQANDSITSCLLHSGSPLSSAAAPLELMDDSGGSMQEEQSSPAHTLPPRPSRSDPGKVPKWLKLPGKK